ncbi:MAG: Na/Pi symporter [Pseudomonadales bacterium]|nr:Na/Pi symporter [Pseudomonadales bacterium]
MIASVPELNFVFGLGIFLLGMSQLEHGIRRLSDSRLRHWLRTSTGTPLSSVITGTVSTALLQSSSMVSLLVLAFASAGLIPFVNSVGIILGANLGTTLTGWLVAIFGFKLSLEVIALPLMGISAYFLAISKREAQLHSIAIVVFGIALLLFGLDLMKSGMESIPERWNVDVLQGHYLIFYLLFGIGITFLVQSSSAVMMMALAALNAEIIGLPEAVALVIGADLGTTSTTALGSINGSSIKRKLAFAHFSYNLVVDVAAFVFLLPVLPALTRLIALSDPLFTLVAFHSFMNAVGLIVFLPFLSFFAGLIDQLFLRGKAQPSNLLDRVTPDVVDAALVALRSTVEQITLQAACNSLRFFNLKPEQLKIVENSSKDVRLGVTHQDFSKGYEDLKNQEGEIIAYSIKIQKQPLAPNEIDELEKMRAITRHVVFSNKSLKDILQDLQQLRYSTSPLMHDLYDMHKQFQKKTYESVIELLLGDHTKEFVLEELVDIQKANDDHLNKANLFVQDQVSKEPSAGAAASIQFNTNREIRHALKTLIKAVELLVDSQERSRPDHIQPEFVGLTES